MNAEEVFAALDAAEHRISRAVGRAVRRFLGRASTMSTLGEMYGWWGQQVDDEVAHAIRETWVTAWQTYADGPITLSSLEGLDVYMTRVKDRLVRGLDPPLPEHAFDLVRQAVVYGAAHGWSTQAVAQQIAASLGWEKDSPYWRDVKAEADDMIDVQLDKLGPPGTPAREWARMNDPQVQMLRDQRNLATQHLDAENSYWQDRAIKIARTESTGAFNAAALAALTDEGWAYKEWLATRDTRTRESHRAADGQTVRLQSPFHVGNALLMMPGDPTGSPDEVINCRCAILGSDKQPVSLTAAFNPGQARVPKGNGRLSGRWIDMPWTIMRDLREAVDQIISVSPEMDEAMSHVNMSRDIWNSSSELNKAADALAKNKRPEFQEASAALRDFASVDWYSDPDNPPAPAVGSLSDALETSAQDWVKKWKDDPNGTVWMDYVLDGSEKLNRYLRTGEFAYDDLTPEEQKEYAEDYRSMTEALKSLMTYRTPQAGQLYRTVSMTDASELSHRLQVGESFTEKGFMSTTGLPNFRERYAPELESFRDPESEWDLMLDVPEGTPYLPGTPGRENEAILAPGTRWKVTSRDEATRQIHMELLPPKAKPAAPIINALADEAIKGGFTFDTRTMSRPTTGYVVALRGSSSITKASNKKEAAAQIKEFLKNPDPPSPIIGGWFDKEHNEIVLDYVEIVADKDEAIRRGQDQNQQAIFHLDTMGEIDTGGTGDRVEGAPAATETVLGPSPITPTATTATPVALNVDPAVEQRFQKIEPQPAAQAAAASNPLDGDINCQATVTAYELRRRGLDVVAKTGASPPNKEGWESYFNFTPEDLQEHPLDLRKWLNDQGFDPKAEDAEIQENDPETARDYATSLVLADHGPGERGFMTYSGWSGHIWVWEIGDDGEVSFLDPQTGAEATDSVWDWFARADTTQIARVDDKVANVRVTHAVTTEKEAEAYTAAKSERDIAYDTILKPLQPKQERSRYLRKQLDGMLIKDPARVPLQAELDKLDLEIAAGLKEYNAVQSKTEQKLEGVTIK